MADTMWVTYFRPNACQRTGIKGYEYTGQKYLNNELVLGGGSGTLVVLEGQSHFLLIVKTEDGIRHNVWLENIFRQILGVKKLSSRIRQIIEKTMPRKVGIVQMTGRKGVKYFVLSDESAHSWANVVRLSCQEVE